jgi:hypothetical protein
LIACFLFFFLFLLEIGGHKKEGGRWRQRGFRRSSRICRRTLPPRAVQVLLFLAYASVDFLHFEPYPCVCSCQILCTCFWTGFFIHSFTCLPPLVEVELYQQISRQARQTDSRVDMRCYNSYYMEMNWFHSHF